MKWRDPQQSQQQGGYGQPPLGLYQTPFTPPQLPPQSAQPNSGSSLDNDKVLEVLTSLTQGLQNQAKEMGEVKKQIGQMAEFMGQFREESKQPSSIIVNPKGGFETAKAITLRSGKEVGTNPKTSKQSKKRPKSCCSKKKWTKPRQEKNNLCRNLLELQHHHTKKEENEKDILVTFKVQVNIPLLDAIKQVPRYAKFLKELCTRRRISNKEVVRVSQNVLTVLQRKLSPKCKDPGSFTIPCVIGNTKFEYGMLDLGASISVMSYSIYASMNLGELKNDGVIIQLADRSNAYPKRVLEDVLVEVNHLIFPADFMCLRWRILPILLHCRSYLEDPS